MSNTNESSEVPIIPVKLIQKSLSEQGELSPIDSISEDTIKARGEYDSRLYSSVSLPDNMSHYRLFNFFGFDDTNKSDEKQNDKLKKVYAWANKSVKDGELIGIIECIRDVERRIGFPELGESRLDKVYNYVAIDSQISDLQMEKLNRYGM